MSQVEDPGMGCAPTAGADDAEDQVPPATGEALSATRQARLRPDRVVLQIRDGVAEMRLNRPAAGNAIDAAMVEAFDEAVTVLEAMPPGEVRAVLLTGAGSSFCVGGDLNHMLEHRDHLPDEFAHMIGQWHATLPRFAALPVPVVAAVQGGVAGGGLGPVWCSDIVLAADDLKMISGFSTLALSGDGGSSWHLPRLVGLRRAQQFMLCSQPLSAQEALEWGLVTRVITPGELSDQARREAENFAQGPTFAYGQMKQLLLRSGQRSYPEALLAERDAMLACSAHADVLRGMQGFLSGQRPTFKGH